VLIIKPWGTTDQLPAPLVEAEILYILAAYMQSLANTVTHTHTPSTVVISPVSSPQAGQVGFLCVENNPCL
jgi:hypothetical protein